MFRTAELGRSVSQEEFDRLSVDLRIELIDLQQRLRTADFPVILVFAGVNGAGKRETVKLLNEWMDPRWLVTRAYGKPTEEEAERPEFWRYWRDLPPKGRIGMFLSSWYSMPLVDHAYGRITDAQFDEKLNRINAFEKALADGGALILKFWMHLGKKAQKKRLKSLEKHPHEGWRITAEDWKNWEMYDHFIHAAERVIMRTSMSFAPWTIVEGSDPRYRALTVLTTFRDATQRHIELRELHNSLRRQLTTLPAEGAPAAEAAVASGVAAAKVAAPRQPTILHSLDMTKQLDKDVFKDELKEQRARLNRLHRAAKERDISSVVLFEGWDAAGKGGAIRHLTTALDPRDYDVIPIAKPTDEESLHHYLWRFWRHLGRAGRVTIFDRSWYGRVLVERVEGFATQEEWMRAFPEINHFEQQLVEHGIVLVKYWLHITHDEQLRRFERRSSIPYKAWKLTDEDWRNRDKWEHYEAAVNDMVEHTSTRITPWTLIEANDKSYTRIQVIRTLCDRFEAALDRSQT